jgi:chromosome segregation ATPase
MVYNDYVVCDSKKIKTPALFVANRPDKDTVVVDYQDKLHEVSTDKVRLAKHEEIMRYFKQRIKGLENVIEITNKEIERYQNKMNNCEEAVVVQKEKIDELNIKLDGLSVAKRLLKSEDPRKVVLLKVDISELGNTIKFEQDKLERFQEGVLNYLQRMQTEQEYLDQLTRRLNKAYEQFKLYQERVEEREFEIQ